jgi:hypothetical protein
MSTLKDMQALHAQLILDFESLKSFQSMILKQESLGSEIPLEVYFKLYFEIIDTLAKFSILPAVFNYTTAISRRNPWRLSLMNS